MYNSAARRVAAAAAVVVAASVFAYQGSLAATVRDAEFAEVDRSVDTLQAGPEVSIGNASVREKKGEARLIVSLDSPADHDVSVSYATVDGTARAPEDYTSATGTATVPAGTTSTAIVLLIIDDTEEEETETFSVRLSEPQGGTIRVDGESGTVTVVDADPGPNLGYLFAVYIVTWAAFFGYVFTMSRRRTAMQREVEALRATITKNDDTDCNG